MNDETFESMAVELNNIHVEVDAKTLGALLAAGMAILALHPDFLTSSDNEAKYIVDAVKVASEILNDIPLNTVFKW